MERELWRLTFLRSDIPPFVCPRCKQGRLILDEKTFHYEEPTHSKAAQAHEAWDVDWVEERFVMFLRCGIPKCGEVVAVAGDTSVEQVIKDDGDWEYESLLRPRSMFPGPPIITIPDETPAEVRQEIQLSFQLFWTDHGACASRLRKSVELLIDDFKIPREGKDKKGKTYRLSLQERVNAFKTIDAEYGAALDALRIVGNLGTHGELKRVIVLDAYEIYEDALAELLKKQKSKIKDLKNKIISKKGKY
jgi:Domain of unknown function (DUF4145)